MPLRYTIFTPRTTPYPATAGPIFTPRLMAKALATLAGHTVIGRSTVQVCEGLYTLATHHFTALTRVCFSNPKMD